jgi:hypothetical protein
MTGVSTGRPSGRRDLVTAALGTWFTVGLMLDAWAHNNIPRLETFFTPWHAVFYSGFVACAGWLLLLVRGTPLTRAGWRSLPAGYRASMLAIAGFGLGGVADFSWHTVFGIEQNLGILFSPTHLLLISTMFVIVTTPLRSAAADPALRGAPGLRALLPSVLAVALAAAQVLLFVQYGNALANSPDGVVTALTNEDQLVTAHFLASMVLTTLILLGPLLYLAARWTVPPGTVSAIAVACGGLSAAVTGFENLALIGALLLAGLAGDTVLALARPGPGRRSATLLVAALVPLLTWTFIVATACLVAPSSPNLLRLLPRQSSLELLLGAPLLQAVAGLLLAHLVLGPRRPPAEVGGTATLLDGEPTGRAARPQ